MPQLKKTFSDQQLNDSRSNALILVNGREISVLNGLETKLVMETKSFLFLLFTAAKCYDNVDS